MTKDEGAAFRIDRIDLLFKFIVAGSAPAVVVEMPTFPGLCGHFEVGFHYLCHFMLGEEAEIGD